MPQDSPPVYSGCVLQYQGFRLGVQFRLCVLYLTRPLPEGLKDLVGSAPDLSLQFCFGDVLLKVSGGPQSKPRQGHRGLGRMFAVVTPLPSPLLPCAFVQIRKTA